MWGQQSKTPLLKTFVILISFLILKVVNLLWKIKKNIEVYKEKLKAFYLLSDPRENHC